VNRAEGRGPTKKKDDSKKQKEVTIDEFDRFDLRAGRIVEAERVPNTDKLLKLTVDIGETRTLVASIGKASSPEALLDQSAPLLDRIRVLQREAATSTSPTALAVITDRLRGLVEPR